ncbi:lectin-like protein [Seonamhaeicola maritimus]|nr:lectin-like protein [Seonamhaeicola maritimus]
MKKLLLLLFIAPVIMFGQKEKIINVNDITQINGIFYFKLDSTLVSGKVTGKVSEWYENGQLKKQGTFKDGKAVGITEIWYENGPLRTHGRFKNGNKDGLWKEWYENGQLMAKATFEDGNLDGLNKEWYENGQLKSNGRLKNGKKDGVWKKWYKKNGQLMAKATFEDGNLDGFIKEWYENGQLKLERRFLDGKMEGFPRFWDEDGRVISEKTYKDVQQIKRDLPQTIACYKKDEIPILVNKFNYSGHHYKYIKKSVSWDVAKQLAEKEGGYLAVFETLEEMNYVTAASRKKSTYWVGISDSQKEGNWIWVNGKMINNNMLGYLENGNDLDNRDYGHIMLQRGLMSRHISGGLPKGWKGQMCVSGYLIEFDSID